MKKLFLIIFIPFVFTFGQELEATVTVNYEQLTTAYKDKMVGFRQQIQDYLNNNQFTGEKWEWQKIKCNFNVFFTGGSNEVNYNAQVVVTSQRPIEGQQKSTLILSIMDNSWSFNYEPNQSMYFNQTDFDPLTSFLDYYAYIIIGFENESYEREGGTASFDKALNIAVKGSSSSSPDPWLNKSSGFNKRALVDDLLNASFMQFRHDFTDYHYNGIDLYYQNKEKTYESMVKMIHNLEKLQKRINKRSVLLTVFFDAKNGEFVDYLKNYEDKSIFNILQKIDVGHTTKYLEAMEK
ncbi:MAG: hypothetical protein CVV23_12965 [Ignavibacteriae bacterium HGW-Ignavibacteriae-2]|jgi:hypothetical protein|nr:MAG: hypothetical protein CVV23_12965 [Ignavibacteriae bacterium HGW-Ignavibacteriae-2]